MDDAEYARRIRERLARVNRRLVEVDRLARHPHQQHAMAMLHVASAIKAAKADKRSYWVLFARMMLRVAADIRTENRDIPCQTFQ